MIEKNIPHAAVLTTINRKVQAQILEVVAFAEASSFLEPTTQPLTVYNYIYKPPHYPFLQY
ncbi:hypothetical protein [Candidatus Cardinium hertigii]|jgi:hypothetical protein|uniref:Uncharacterized protein n=1 Tax=Candidatus Cardinium hertigii TaxID=247481 RepID=A0A3N2QCE2_9BACT|nr:hypothetical protein [Candidatus Cardinium hertigii]ROT47454.1 hypothetical protein EDM02_02245 [Candidatus Cardinium hertigii]